MKHIPWSSWIPFGAKSGVELDTDRFAFAAGQRSRQQIRRSILRRLIAHHKQRDGSREAYRQDFAGEAENGATDLAGSSG